MKFRSDGAGNELNGFLDRGSHLQGELRFETTFRVEGKITGTISSSGNLVVGEHGEVDGEIRVGEIFVAGTVRGTIAAERKVHLAPGGKVYAELRTPTLVIEDGALFEGRCGMDSNSVPAAPATAPSDAALASAEPQEKPRGGKAGRAG